MCGQRRAQLDRCAWTRTLALRERETHNIAGVSDGVRCLVPLIDLSIHSINNIDV